MSSSPLTIGEIRVTPMSRILVVPTTPTPEHWLPLSNLDRVVNPTFSSIILFYTNLLDGSRTFEDISRTLKDSLAKVLVHFYPLAGRLALREDGLVDLHCNDEGAVFIEASVEAELSSLGGPQPMPSLSGLEVAGVGKGPKYVPNQIMAMPALVIQLTLFKCGSVAIAANWHHTVADGSSGCHFMKSWAEMGAGLSELSLIPNHDRWLLKPRDTLDSSLVNGYSTKDVEKVLLKFSERVLQEPALLTSFHIGKSVVQGLKEKVSLEDDMGRHFTSAESISGYLWQQMTKARAEFKVQQAADLDDFCSYPYQSDSNTRFFTFVDGRKKLNLPAGYFGNVVCSACAVCSEEEILNNPVSHAASLIRNATRGISGEYFRSLIDWVESRGTAPYKSEHINSMGHDVAATFWTFFPLYEMNFGWGRPSLGARNSPPRPLIDGIAMMPSPDGPGNMVALLNLHADRMNRLLNQASFKVFTHPEYHHIPAAA